MSTTTAPPVRVGQTFQVVNYIGDTEHEFVGQRFTCSCVSEFGPFVNGYNAPTAFHFSEVVRVETTAEECPLCFKPCDEPSGVHLQCAREENAWADFASQGGD